MENQISMLPQPTTRPTGGMVRALNEVSESENNTRNAMPPPPSATGLKRQGSNLPEPAQKRKTLVERAGESLRPPSTVSAISRPPSATSHYASSTASLYRSASNTSSISRSNSMSSRNTSNSSYAGSLSSGIRPPTITSTPSTVRPKSSYAKDKPFGTVPRANTSIASLQVSHEAHNNKSKTPSLSNLHGPMSTNRIPWKTLPSPTRHKSLSELGRGYRARKPLAVNNMRDRAHETSLCTQLSRLHLNDNGANSTPVLETPIKHISPTRIPKASTTPGMNALTPDTIGLTRTPCLRHKPTMLLPKFLTPSSNIESFDPDVPYQDWKRMFDDSRQMFEDAVTKIATAKEESNTYREQLTQIEQERSTQTESIILLKSENRMLQFRIEGLENSISQTKQENESRVEELKQEYRTGLETMRQQHRDETEKLRLEYREELRELKQTQQEEIEQERRQKAEILSQVSTEGALEKQQHQIDLSRKDQEIAAARAAAEHVRASLEREKQVNDDLRESLRMAGDNTSSMEIARQGLEAKIAYLESDGKAQSEAYASMEMRMNEAIAKSETIENKLRKEETTRRKLHNQIQELKGNIRVFCRVRPTLSADEELASMKFPDQDHEATEIEIRGSDEKNSLGKDVTKHHPFNFDRVFSPSQSNDDVFEEISQLIQSALDGYNVCIFAYGQTGSGKTYTMSAEDGMIPRALRLIYEKSKDLEDRGWSYKMQGSFVEVYNEEIRDLLGDDSYRKHDVHHDLSTQETTITNATTLMLDSKEQVESILSQAMARRSVAATKANEHSSRSHSVFILKLVGKNRITGEESKGTLNLVDLAGSERIKNADTSGQRLKETQSINKSLSCLGDVIGALGQGPSPSDSKSSANNTRDGSTSHIPYRNSRLTYLLQMSLGGNCKTLMFVMVAPEKRCLYETITSLKFADKVSRTRVGVAKRTK